MSFAGSPIAQLLPPATPPAAHRTPTRGVAMAPSARLYRPPAGPAVPPSTSRLAAAPSALFAYLQTPTPPPDPKHDGYCSNLHSRVDAYVHAQKEQRLNSPERGHHSPARRRRRKEATETAAAAASSWVDHRPPAESFDEYHEDFHETFSPTIAQAGAAPAAAPATTTPLHPPSSPGVESRRAAYLRIQARARRIKAKALGLIDSSDEEEEDGGAETKQLLEEHADADAKASEEGHDGSPAALDSTPHERKHQRRLAREKRKATQRAKQLADEERMRKEHHLSLLTSFNTQMETSKNVDIATAAAVLMAAGRQQSPALTTASGAASSPTHTSMSSAAASSASTPPSMSHASSFARAMPTSTTSVLPIVLPGAPVFQFHPSQSHAYAQQAQAKALTKAEEKRREQQFEREKRELVQFLLGRTPTPTPPATATGAESNNEEKEDEPMGGLKRIAEEQHGNSSPHSRNRSLSPSAARRSVGFRQGSSPPRTARPSTTRSGERSEQHQATTSIRPRTSSGSTVSGSHSARPPTTPRSARLSSASGSPSTAAAGSSGLNPSRGALAAHASHTMLGSNKPFSRTLTLESKLAAEKAKKAQALFDRVCGGLTATTSQSTAESSTSAVAAVPMPKFGLDLSVEELSRNIKQEQRCLAQGLWSSASSAHEPPSTPLASTAASSSPVTAGSTPKMLSRVSSITGKVPGDNNLASHPSKSHLHASTREGGADAFVSGGPPANGGAATPPVESEEVADVAVVAVDPEAIQREQENREKAKRVAAAAATGEYTAVSPELVNALLKATKRGDATMCATLIAQVTDEQRQEFIDMKDKNGSTAIFHTVWPGHFYALRVLLQAGADPNIQNLKKNTALHLAVERGHQNLIRCLLEHKADYTLVNYENKLCYQTPAREEDRILMERFIKNCAAEVKRGTQSNFKLDIDALKAKKEDDPFQKEFYRQHGWQAAELKTLQAADLVQSPELRQIMAFEKPVKASPGQLHTSTAGAASGTRPNTTAPGATRPTTTSGGTRPNTTTGGSRPSTSNSRDASSTPSPHHTPAALSRSLTSSPLVPSPSVEFTKFLHHARAHPLWPQHTLVHGRGPITGEMRVEGRMRRKWRKQQRKEQKERRRKEKEERRARARAEDPYYDEQQEEEQEQAKSRPTTRATTRTGARTANLLDAEDENEGLSRPQTRGAQPTTEYRLDRQKSLDVGEPRTPGSVSFSPNSTIMMEQFAGFDLAQQMNGDDGGDQSRTIATPMDEDDDFTAGDDEFESLLPSSGNGAGGTPLVRPRSNRSRLALIHSRNSGEHGGHASVSSLATSGGKNSRSTSRNRHARRSPEPNSSESSALFLFSAAAAPSASLGASEITHLSAGGQVQTGVEIVLANRAASMVGAGGQDRATRDVVTRIQREGLTPQRPSPHQTTLGDTPRIHAFRPPHLLDSPFSSASFQSSTSSGFTSATAPQPFVSPLPHVPLDAPAGTPVIDLESAGFVQPLSQRMGMATPSSPIHGGASAVHAASLALSSRSRPPAASVLSPPFHFSDDFGATARWAVAINTDEEGGGGKKHSGGGEDVPPPGITPSVFPDGYPFHSNERVRPTVSALTAPSLVAKAEQMGVYGRREVTGGGGGGEKEMKTPAHRSKSPVKTPHRSAVKKPRSGSHTGASSLVVDEALLRRGAELLAHTSTLDKIQRTGGGGRMELAEISDDYGAGSGSKYLTTQRGRMQASGGRDGQTWTPQVYEEKQQPSASAAASSSGLDLGSAAWHSHAFHLLPTTVSATLASPEARSASFTAQQQLKSPAPLGHLGFSSSTPRPNTQGDLAGRAASAPGVHPRDGSSPTSSPSVYSSFPSPSPPPPSGSRAAAKRPPIPVASKVEWGQVIPQRNAPAMPPSPVVVAEGRDYLFQSAGITNTLAHSYQPVGVSPPPPPSAHQLAGRSARGARSSPSSSDKFSVIASRFHVTAQSIEAAMGDIETRVAGSSMHATKARLTPDRRDAQVRLLATGGRASGEQRSSRSHTPGTLAYHDQLQLRSPDSSLYLHPKAMAVHTQNF